MAHQVIVCSEQNHENPIEVCEQEEEFKRIRMQFMRNKFQQLRRDTAEIRRPRLSTVPPDPFFFTSLRAHLNTDHSTNDKTKRYNLSDSTIQFVEEEDQFDFLCEGFDSPRARMSCGHVVTPMSLTRWCQQLLKQGETRFVCGQSGCDAEWPYEEVCKMAVLTPGERKNFETTLALNVAARDSKAKFCPGCMTPVTRGSSSNLFVCCQVCTAKTGRSFGFCWQCLREWKGQQPRLDRCENDDCHNSALKTLRECPEVQIELTEGLKGCPSVRACPTCGSLLQHTGKGCKNIRCPRCKMSFCLGCLKSAGCSCSVTGIAPRQTSIPVWQRK